MTRDQNSLFEKSSKCKNVISYTHIDYIEGLPCLHLRGWK